MLKMFPRVILADKKSKLVLSGDELKNGYLVNIAVQSMEKYNLPHSDKFFIDEDKRYAGENVEVKGGKATFYFTPYGEQRHRVYVDTGARKVVFEIFSLKKDLYELQPFKGRYPFAYHRVRRTFHADRNRFGILRRGFRLYGYNRPPQVCGFGKMAALMDKIATHFKVYPGEEVHNRGMGYFHIINFGASSSVNEIINADPDGVFKKVTENAAELKKQYKLPDEIDEKEFAFRHGVSENIRKNGGVSVLCHPYWDAYGEYNMQTPMLEFLLKNGIFDALEVVDDDDKTGNGVNLQVAMYNDMRAKGIKIPVVGASDCHNVVSELFGKFYTYAFCKNVNDVKEAVKNLKSVAVERIGKEYRIYGEFRLVRYARFLTDNFYPEVKEIRKGTAAKIAEAIEKESAEIMSAIENVTEEYRKAFFGRR